VVTKLKNLTVSHNVPLYGKTMVLTERIIHLIENGIDPARLLAITFAKKAVLEIQSRLEKRLNGNGTGVQVRDCARSQ
jgi:superfamily I DNA/RNA helicase